MEIRLSQRVVWILAAALMLLTSTPCLAQAASGPLDDAAVLEMARGLNVNANSIRWLRVSSRSRSNPPPSSSAS